MKTKMSFDMILTKSLILRIALGGMLLLMGYMKLQGGTSAFVDAFAPAFDGSILPAGLVSGFLTIVPAAEFVLGFLLFFGLFTKEAARVTGLLFAIYIVGLTALNDPNFALGIIANFIYIYAVFKLICCSHCMLSVDHVMKCRKGKCMEDKK